MNELETSPMEGSAPTKKKSEHRTLVMVVSFLVALALLVGLNMN
jgi:hypothetical protein